MVFELDSLIEVHLLFEYGVIGESDIGVRWSGVNRIDVECVHHGDVGVVDSLSHPAVQLSNCPGDRVV